MRPSCSPPKTGTGIPLPMFKSAGMIGSFLPPDSHGINEMASSGTYKAQCMAGKETSPTSRGDELATKFDEMEINEALDSAASEGEGAAMHMSTACESTTSVSLRLFTYPNRFRLAVRPLNKPKFAIGRKPGALIQKTPSREASKTSRRIE